MTFHMTSVSLTYQTASSTIHALASTDVSLRDNEVLVLIGPSGCGKSTLLLATGGILRPTTGSITFAGEPFTEPDPTKAAFVFQDYSLLPWRTIVQNVGIGLKFANVRKRERVERSMEMLRLVGLSQFAHAYPHELSGGMQQRVAVARAMVMDPKVLLMDEPFGALDEITRRQLGFEMGRIITQTGKSVMMVTHSLDEALFWGDRVLVMSTRPGRIVAELIVDRPRPRELSFIKSSEFADMRATLFQILSEQIADQNASLPAEAAR